MFGQIIYFRHGLDREIYFHVAWARENLFSYINMGPVNHSPLRQLITRNSYVIESSSIRWNYYDKSSFDLATLCITTNLRHYTSLSLKKKMKSRPVKT